MEKFEQLVTMWQLKGQTHFIEPSGAVKKYEDGSECVVKKVLINSRTHEATISYLDCSHPDFEETKALIRFLDIEDKNTHLTAAYDTHFSAMEALKEVDFLE